MTFIINPYRFGGGIVPTQSLSFDPSTDFLNMTDANWGAYNDKKFAIVASIYVDSLADNRPIYSRFVSTSSFEFFLEIETGGAVTFSTRSSGSDSTIQSAGSSITTATWYAIMVHYDSDAASSSDRMKMWINNSAITPSFSSYPASGAAVDNTSAATAIGYRDRFGGLYMDGLIFAPSFFSGDLPSASDTFDGSSGKLKGLTGLPGLFSQADGTTATNDYVKATDWTNNGTVTTSATVP